MDDLWDQYWKTRSVDDRNRLVVSYMGVATGMVLSAKKRRKLRFDGADLRQVAHIALIEAVEKFQFDGRRFEQFLWLVIRCRMLDYVCRAKRQLKSLNRDVAAKPACNAKFELDAFWQHILRGLGSKDRLAVLLRYRAELTGRECAEHFGVTELQASRDLKQAVSKLSKLRRLEAAHV